MEIFTAHQAKANLSRLMRKAESGEEVVIARGKTPVVRLVAIRQSPKKRLPGLFKGEFSVGPGFFEPLPLSELKGWR